MTAQNLPEASGFDLDVLGVVDDRLRYIVTGTVVCPQVGYRVWLQPGYEGIWDDPTRAVLELRAEAPQFGPHAVTPVPVAYSSTEHPSLREVTIRLMDGVSSGDGGETIILRAGTTQGPPHIDIGE